MKVLEGFQVKVCIIYVILVDFDSTVEFIIDFDILDQTKLVSGYLGLLSVNMLKVLKLICLCNCLIDAIVGK